MKTATGRTRRSSVATQHAVVIAAPERASWLPKRPELQFATPGVQTASRSAEVMTCISETENDVEPTERIIKRNSALRSNPCSRARFVTAKGVEPASSQHQDCGQLQGGADIVTCIVGNEDCLQSDLELISRDSASHVSFAVEGGPRLPQGRELQVRDSRQERRQRGAEQHPGT